VYSKQTENCQVYYNYNMEVKNISSNDFCHY